MGDRKDDYEERQRLKARIKSLETGIVNLLVAVDDYFEKYEDTGEWKGGWQKVNQQLDELRRLNGQANKFY